MLADELEARLQNKTRHEVKAEIIREAKGKLKCPRMTDQFALRPLAPAVQQSAPKELGRLLAQLEYLGTDKAS